MVEFQFRKIKMGSTSLSRENFLEKKIQILDKRLTQVEKFIALRFRKTEKDYYLLQYNSSIISSYI